MAIVLNEPAVRLEGSSYLENNQNISGIANIETPGYLLKDPNGNVYAKPFPTILPLGRYYSVVGRPAGGFVVVSQRIYAYPLDWTQTRAFGSLSIDVTGGLGVGQSCRFALYATDAITGLPGSLLMAPPSFSLSVGANTQRFSYPVKMERLWVAVVASGGNVRRCDANSAGLLGMPSPTGISAADGVVYKLTTALNFPSPFGSPDGFLEPTNAPHLWWE